MEENVHSIGVYNLYMYIYIYFCILCIGLQRCKYANTNLTYMYVKIM